MAVVVYSEAGGYGTTEVAEVMGLSPRQVRAFVYAGLLEPVRGPRGDYRFSFQDLVLLRMGAQLQRARVPLRAVKKALQELRVQLADDDLPLSAVRVDALGETVIARDREGVWAPETGQRYFPFTLPAAEASAAATAVLEPTEETEEPWVEPRFGGETATQWFDRAVDLEDTSLADAKAAYRRVLELDPSFADAHANLGRLLHQEGRIDLAVRHYRAAAQADPGSATAAFNLGVALEDLERPDDAAAAYRQALVADPGRPEPHFNLARLYEAGGQEADALRHLVEYRRLSRGQ
ncbi:MAG: tetratricopeptide repeat protein [Gemmatimonadota bacterium]